VGPSPAIMHVTNLKKLVPLWFDLSVKMKADREADGGQPTLALTLALTLTLTFHPNLDPGPDFDQAPSVGCWRCGATPSPR